jgi:hypothetical protein
MVAAAGGLSQDGRRRRSPLAAVASHERRRGNPPKHGLPRLALMDGNSGRLGRTNGGRWGEATRR